MKFLSEGQKGLDYGCGPNPVLAQLVAEKGITCDYYDPFFFPQCSMDKKYDFVFATECFEHFFNPGSELKRISSLLNVNGTLNIMTELLSDMTAFDGWYYKNDPTHVCFYSHQSIRYICDEYKYAELYNDNHRVIILRKI